MVAVMRNSKNFDEPPFYRKGIRLKFLNQVVRSQVVTLTKPREAGGTPGKSSLFFFTVMHSSAFCQRKKFNSRAECFCCLFFSFSFWFFCFATGKSKKKREGRAIEMQLLYVYYLEVEMRLKIRVSSSVFSALCSGDQGRLLSFWYPRKQVVWRRGTMTGKSISFSEVSSVVTNSP